MCDESLIQERLAIILYGQAIDWSWTVAPMRRESPFFVGRIESVFKDINIGRRVYMREDVYITGANDSLYLKGGLGSLLERYVDPSSPKSTRWWIGVD